MLPVVLIGPGPLVLLQPRVVCVMSAETGQKALRSGGKNLCLGGPDVSMLGLALESERDTARPREAHFTPASELLRRR